MFSAVEEQLEVRGLSLRLCSQGTEVNVREMMPGFWRQRFVPQDRCIKNGGGWEIQTVSTWACLSRRASSNFASLIQSCRLSKGSELRERGGWETLTILNQRGLSCLKNTMLKWQSSPWELKNHEKRLFGILSFSEPHSCVWGPSWIDGHWKVNLAMVSHRYANDLLGQWDSILNSSLLLNLDSSYFKISHKTFLWHQSELRLAWAI